jgi:hypothetical protein
MQKHLTIFYLNFDGVFPKLDGDTRGGAISLNR